MFDGAWLLAALQYGDSAYPAGGYAHSWGLETAVAERQVHDAATLAGACRSYLRHQAGPTDAVAASACSLAAAAGDLSRFTEVDRRLSATRPAREAREGSARLGRRLLDTAAAAEGLPWITGLRGHVLTGETPGNQASVLGAIAGAFAMPPGGVATMALWTATSGFLNAGLRLLRVTHDDIQAIHVAMRPLIERLATEAVVADPLEMAGSAPQLEIWSMRHETATMRLFAS